MIIFDLDGTLANCNHRLHFICEWKANCRFGLINGKLRHVTNSGEEFKPNYEAFEDCCDKDTPNEAPISLWDNQVSAGNIHSLHVLTTRSERIRDKTIRWLDHHLLCFNQNNLTMRPIGDFTPDEQLKERWLDDHLTGGGKPINMVFDSHTESVAMWRRRGITCFQASNGEF